jgi:hypothetical protein
LVGAASLIAHEIPVVFKRAYGHRNTVAHHLEMTDEVGYQVAVFSASQSFSRSTVFT